jgi:hypothetical protein
MHLPTKARNPVLGFDNFEEPYNRIRVRRAVRNGMTLIIDQFKTLTSRGANSSSRAEFDRISTMQPCWRMLKVSKVMFQWYSKGVYNDYPCRIEFGQTNKQIKYKLDTMK